MWIEYQIKKQRGIIKPTAVQVDSFDNLRIGDLQCCGETSIAVLEAFKSAIQGVGVDMPGIGFVRPLTQPGLSLSSLRCDICNGIHLNGVQCVFLASS